MASASLAVDNAPATPAPPRRRNFRREMKRFTGSLRGIFRDVLRSELRWAGLRWRRSSRHRPATEVVDPGTEWEPDADSAAPGPLRAGNRHRTQLRGHRPDRSVHVDGAVVVRHGAQDVAVDDSAVE